jgi:uncharacterized protein YegP (UPF0339 family)
MDNIINFFTKPIQLSEMLSVPVWVFFTVALAIILVGVVLIFSSKSIKKSKPNNKVEQVIEETPLPSAEEASKQYFEVVNKEIDLPEEVVPVIEEVVEETPVIEEKTPVIEVEKPVETVEADVDTEVTATVDDIVYIKEATIEKQIAGKFAIINSSVGGYRYALIANNGQLLYESRDYKAKNTCVDAVEKFCNAVKESDFTVKKDKFNRFKFVLRPKNNANTLFIGESFKDRTGCLSNIESVKRFVFANSPIVDRTSDEFAAESSTYDVPEDVKKAADNKIGMPGKWEINKIEEDGSRVFEYLLFANNGQLLYESKEYKSYASCKSGMFTFIETVKNGKFIVDSDKAGRYKFILRSNKAGSQAEYIGQFYRSLDACQSSINSVYKFALLSSTENID